MSPDRMVLKEKITRSGPRLFLSIIEIKEVKSLITLLTQLVLKTKAP